MQYFDTEINQNYIPYVIETSIGLDRMFLLTLCHAYTEEKWMKEDGSEDSRVVLRMPAKLAPIKLAVLPLTEKRRTSGDCPEHYQKLPGRFLLFL